MHHNQTQDDAAAELHVLVVDDDEGFLRYAERALVAAGYRCRLAANLQTARSLLRGETFDVVMLDIHLPDGSGLEFLQSLPELSAELPVIVATGQASVTTAVQALHLDVMDYLTKPEIDLQAVIERAVGRFRRSKQAAQVPRDKSAWIAQLRAIADYLGSHETSAAQVRPPALQPPRSSAWAQLSKREKEVVHGLLQGQAPASVAEQLGIGLSTVRNHIQSAYRRLGVSSQLELLAKLREGSQS